MTAIEKLSHYQDVLRRWLKAQRDHDPAACDWKEPQPERYGLKTYSELFAARLAKDRIEKEFPQK